jgi:hypothetical protein
MPPPVDHPWRRLTAVLLIAWASLLLMLAGWGVLWALR